MTTPLNTRPAQMCTCSARNGMHRADERIAAPKSVAGTFETCRLRRAMSEFGAKRETYARAEFFSVSPDSDLACCGRTVAAAGFNFGLPAMVRVAFAAVFIALCPGSSDPATSLIPVVTEQSSRTSLEERQKGPLT